MNHQAKYLKENIGNDHAIPQVGEPSETCDERVNREPSSRASSRAGCNVETRVSIMGDDPPLCGNRVLRGDVCSVHGRDEIEARKRMIEQNLRENERHAARIAVLEGRAEP